MATVVKGFRYTGGAQTFVVPPNVTSVLFELWGAPGGQTDVLAAGNSGVSGSTGAMAFNNGYSNVLVKNVNNIKSLVGYVKGTLAVTPGSSYGVYVGGAGGYGNAMDIAADPGTTNYGPGGWNGGGNGGYVDTEMLQTADPPNSRGIQSPGGGGGGATDIRSGGTALANRILVAGGGGGAGGISWPLGVTATAVANPTTPAPPYSNDLVPGSGDNGGPNNYPNAGSAYGGSGGPNTGSPGGGASRGSSYALAGTGGRGGQQTAGGAGGTSTGTFSNAGQAGDFSTVGTGGHGGNVTASDFSGSSQAATLGGGGGGGGYHGGGGGASGTITTAGNGSAGGGGGGANFISGSFTGTVNDGHVPPAGVDGQQGVNGYARLTYVQPPDAPAISGPVTGDFVDANSALRVAWMFTSPDTSETQAGFDIAYSVAGAGIWTTIPNPVDANGFYDLAAHTLTAGTDYDIRVRVYDTAGDVSAWSTVTVHAVAVPSAPTITSPANGSTLSTNPFNVAWTVDAGVTETIYRVTAEDAAGNVQVDSGDLYSTRVNACTNPSFEASTAGWSTVGGCSLAQSTTYSVVPTHSGKITWATGAAFTQAISFQFPTIPGKTYTVSGSYTVGTVGTDPPVYIVALDGDQSTALGSNTLLNPSVAGTFVRGSATFVAQSNVSYIQFVNAGAATAGQVGYVDAVLVEYGSNANSYFDGSNANGNPGTPSWQGTTDLSASQLAVANVLLYSVNWPLPSQPIVIKVRYADTVDQNLYSAPGVSAPTVNLNPPDVPTVSLSLDNDAGTVTLHIANPPGTFSAVYNEVWRRDLTNGTPEVKLATVTPSTDFVDYTPVTQTIYAYRVRAYSSDGGFADAT